MDKFEKAERLRNCANVTYEEALEALDASEGDLLDAVVKLEQEGRIEDSGHSTYSTDYQSQVDYINVSYRVEQQQQDAPTFRKSIAKLFRTVIWFVKSTSLKVTRSDAVVFKLPSWVMALILLAFWRVLLPAAVIALLFGFRYSFEGNEDAEAANNVLSKAGEIADDVTGRMRRDRKS